MDILLGELVLMNARTDLYLRFLKNKSLVLEVHISSWPKTITNGLTLICFRVIMKASLMMKNKQVQY